MPENLSAERSRTPFNSRTFNSPGRRERIGARARLPKVNGLELRHTTVDAAPDLKIPKYRVPVEVALAGRIVAAQVFLADHARDHLGPERVSDRLNGDEEFIPMMNQEQQVIVVARRSVLWVRIAASASAGENPLPGEATPYRVQLTLDDGTGLSGALRFAAPPDRARLQDCLNDAAPFVPLYTDGALVLVNRARIASVTSLAE